MFVGDSLVGHAMRHGNVNWTTPSLPCLSFGEICQTGGFITGYGSLTGGAGYTPGTYIDIPFTGGTGANCIGNVTVSGGGVASITIQSPGYGYVVGDVLSVAAASVGGSGAGFAFTVTSVQGPQRYNGYMPLSICADMSAWKASDWANYCTNTYPSVFTDFPGKYIVIALGSNADISTSVYQASMVTIINQALSAGKTVILEKCINNFSQQTAYNAVVASLYTTYPSIIPGVDMSGFQFNYLQPHPDSYGTATQRIVRAMFACQLT